jgi:hypothetical protein
VSNLPTRVSSSKQFNYSGWRARERGFDTFLIHGLREEKASWAVNDFCNEMASYVYALGRGGAEKVVVEDLASWLPATARASDLTMTMAG